METIETSIDIQRPVAVVFAFVSDQRHNPEWIGLFKEVQVTPDGPPTVGTQVKAVVSFLGVKLEPTTQITALEPNRSFSFTGSSGPAAVEATMRFEAVGEGTRLSSTFKMEPGGLFKVAGPVFASQFKKQQEADFQRLKALLEAQPG
jgi:carbon monoxide dehydrogenase subunit G